MTTAEIPVHIELRGGNWTAYKSRAPEILVEGGTGTGKTYGILLKRHQNAQEYPGYHGLIVRKVAADLGSSVLRTFEDEVLHEWNQTERRSKQDGVHFFGGSDNEPTAYVYANGSRIVVGGMDRPSKILGTDYDEAFYNEATEGTIEDLETLKTRLRHYVMPYQQLVCDCNPSFEKHPLLLRALAGQMLRIKTTIKDNPKYYNSDGSPTDAGESYVREQLETLTGTRRQRFFLGEWVGMENAIYPQLDPTRHLQELPNPVVWDRGSGALGIDYGRVHLSAVVAVTRDSTGVYWVREVWAEAGGDPQQIEDMARGMKVRYGIRRGRVDPIQEYMGQSLNFSVAKIAAGARKQRIGYVTRLLDAGALVLDVKGRGVQELYDEMLAYRYEVRETDTNIDDVVVRKDDDRVAALEYAIEEITENGTDWNEVATGTSNPSYPRTRSQVSPRPAFRKV